MRIHAIDPLDGTAPLSDDEKKLLGLPLRVYGDPVSINEPSGRESVTIHADECVTFEAFNVGADGGNFIFFHPRKQKSGYLPRQGGDVYSHSVSPAVHSGTYRIQLRAVAKDVKPESIDLVAKGTKGELSIQTKRFTFARNEVIHLQ